MTIRFAVVCIVAVLIAHPVSAQQRPLITEDPEPIGAGRVLVEGGIDYAHNIEYPVSGLKGDLWRVPSIGVSVGLSSIAELQIDGAPYDRLQINQRRTAPLSALVTATGSTPPDVADLIVPTKIRLMAESAGRPELAVRVAP